MSLDNLEINYQSILDALGTPIHIIDTKGFLVFANIAWEQMIGISRTDAIGLPIDEVLDEQHKGFYFSVDFDAKNETAKFNHFEEKINQPVAFTALAQEKQVSMFGFSNSNNQVIFTSSPIYQGQDIKYILTVCQDLTNSSQLLDELKVAIEKNNLISEELKFYRNMAISPNIVSKSPKMLALLKEASYVANTDATILITGESGVGKEVLTNEIYQKSNRKGQPFIRVNCAAIPESLIESELFGYEKGAFTGASKNKPGMFELANKGTLLLDEIGELPKPLQPKLLRVLQNHEIFRVGGTRNIPIDVRLIAATNQDLQDMVQQGTFRSDLFYRLNLISFHIPPLRERCEDIPLLTTQFLNKFNKKYGKNKQITTGALQILQNYKWPGNIRELENLLERMVIIGDDNWISASRLSAYLAENNKTILGTENNNSSLKEMVTNYEKNILLDALTRYGTTYKVAEVLNTPQPTIARKAKLYGLKW
ncbi:MAG: sigma 54-interacting transcriptional regulator [Clostridiales bacterium]|nr:sigma 54-interacting transcriptional regulator [Clostridiales bacterium]